MINADSALIKIFNIDYYMDTLTKTGSINLWKYIKLTSGKITFREIAV